MERHDDNALIVYTDGSCKNSPRRGGFAFSLVIAAGEVDEIHDYNPPRVLGADPVDVGARTSGLAKDPVPVVDESLDLLAPRSCALVRQNARTSASVRASRSAGRRRMASSLVSTIQSFSPASRSQTSSARR